MGSSFLYNHVKNIKLFGQQLIDWANAGADPSEHPSEDWEYDARGNDVWVRCRQHDFPNFSAEMAYRYNPLPKTVTRYLNDGTKIELPKPHTTFDTTKRFWSISGNGTVCDMGRPSNSDRKFFEVGNCFVSAEDAKQWSRYLKHIRTGEPMEKAS